MKISLDFIEEIVANFRRRAEIARRVGIPAVDVVNGRKVPEGWVFDPSLEYYIPPNLRIL